MDQVYFQNFGTFGGAFSAVYRWKHPNYGKNITKNVKILKNNAFLALLAEADSVVELAEADPVAEVDSVAELAEADPVAEVDSVVELAEADPVAEVDPVVEVTRQAITYRTRTRA